MPCGTIGSSLKLPDTMMKNGAPAVTRAVRISEARGRMAALRSTLLLHPSERSPGSSAKHSVCAESTVSKLASVPWSSRLTLMRPEMRGT